MIKYRHNFKKIFLILVFIANVLGVKLKLKLLVLQNTCNLYGGYLVEINDEEENAWISQTLLKDVCMLHLF